MHQLGATRSAHRHNHLLQTPDTFVRAPLPGMRNATAIVHIGPGGGACFTEYTAEFESEGSLGTTEHQRFVYVLEGELEVRDQKLRPGGYAYLPAGDETAIKSMGIVRAAVIEKPYRPLDGAASPAFLIGDESKVSGQPLNEDPALEVKVLLPDNPSFDMVVNTLAFQPGGHLPMVEVHIMEHGLLMLEGGGIYRLDDQWYPVTAGDFIWMASYCPQWFGALGKARSKYLIYKDWNRHPLG